jgi:hypothetical protein
MNHAKCREADPGSGERGGAPGGFHTEFTVNEEPAMRNLTIDGAAGGETKIRHDVTFPLLTLHRGKDRVHFSTGFFQDENITGADFSYEKPITY